MKYVCYNARDKIGFLMWAVHSAVGHQFVSLLFSVVQKRKHLVNIKLHFPVVPMDLEKSNLEIHYLNPSLIPKYYIVKYIVQQ